MAYFDAASAHPLHPAARATLLTAHDAGWADPARLYREARRARMLLDQARESVATVLGAHPDEVSFCASGTQACHLAVLGALAGGHRAGRRVVMSAVEHSAVLQAGAHHVAAGGTMALVEVERTGRVEAERFAATLGPGAALAALQSANHEVGTVQPVEAVAEVTRERGIPLYVDACQSIGRTPVPTCWSLLSASARKWGGPAGVGVLAVRRQTRWRSPLPEDEHEGGRVPGAVALPAVLAAASALEAAHSEAAAEAERLHPLVDLIRERVPVLVPDVEVVGDPVRRLPHLVTFSCLYVDGEALVTELDRAGFAISSGSSCTASTLRPSHVLAAMGVLTHGNVRVSLPRGTARADVDRFLAVLPGVVAGLRERYGARGL
jgi:cysteine desulfurase